MLNDLTFQLALSPENAEDGAAIVLTGLGTLVSGHHAFERDDDDVVATAEFTEDVEFSFTADADTLELALEQFGIFQGSLLGHNGDINVDGVNDDPNFSDPFEVEDTGLNRILGSPQDDRLYGGTGLDFLFGNGGTDTLYRNDGSTFESLDGGLAGDAWKEYAKGTDRVWYVSGTNANDVISVDLVTEPGLLSDHHLVTRLTENNGNFTFSAQVKLDFSATDADGNPVWDASDLLLDLDSLRTEDPDARGESLAQLDFVENQLVGDLLPDEGDFLAIIIDALGGNDVITVGPTTQKTVWTDADAGAGDDIVDIQAGNSILIDQTELGTRNDIASEAFPLGGAAVLVGASAAPVNGRLTSDAIFTVVINADAEFDVVVAAADTLDNASVDDLVDDFNAALVAAGADDVVFASRTASGAINLATREIAFVASLEDDDGATEFSLEILAEAGNAIVDELGFADGQIATGGLLIADSIAYTNLTIDNPEDQDFYAFQLASNTGSDATISLNSAALIDGLGLTLYQSNLDGSISIIGRGADLPDLEGSNDTASTAFALENIDNVSNFFGLTIDSPTDADYFGFGKTGTAVAGDTLNVLATELDEDDGLTVSIVDITDVVQQNTSLEDLTGTIDGDPEEVKFLAFDLEGIDFATSFIKVVSGGGTARYELFPGTGTSVFNEVDLTGGEVAEVSMADLPATYDFTFDPQADVDYTDGATGNSIDVRHGYRTGDAILYVASGAVIGGLTDGETYYAIRLDANSLQLATNEDNALLGVDIDLIDTGATGAHSITPESGAAGITYLVEVDSPNIVPTIYNLVFELEDLGGLAPPVVIDLGQRNDEVRRDVILGGPGDDILSGGPSEDWIFGGDGNDVLTGGVDRQASDLLFGQGGDDTFQIITDDLPQLNPSDDAFVPTFKEDPADNFIPTFNDRFDGGEGNDRILFLGGDLDRLGREVPDFASLRWNRFLQRYEFTNLVWDIANQEYVTTGEVPATVAAISDLESASELGGDATFTITLNEGDPSEVTQIITLAEEDLADNEDITDLVTDLNVQLNDAASLLRGLVTAGFDGQRLTLSTVAAGANQTLKVDTIASGDPAENLGFATDDDGVITFEQTATGADSVFQQQYLFF